MSNTKIMQWKLLVFCLVLLVIFLVRGVFNSHDEQTLKEMRIIMGTMVTITAHHHDAGVLSNAIDAAFKRINQIDALMSTYKEESELSLLNKAKKPGRYPVSNDLWNVLELAGRMYQQTDRVFDVTVKPLWDVWHLAADTNKMPSKSDIKRILDGIGWRHIKLHSDSKEIEFVSESCMIVLGGIAKGYAVDEAAKVAKLIPEVSGVINAGGDIVFFGERSFPLSIRSPLQNGQYFEASYFSNCAVATSVFKERDQEYSISVMSDQCIVADPLTKALWNQNPETKNKLLAKYKSKFMKIDSLLNICDGELLH